MAGYLIENSEVIEVEDEKAALDRARDPDLDNGNQVFWTREAAEDELAYRLDPVGVCTAKYKAGELSRSELLQIIGPLAAERIENG